MRTRTILTTVLAVVIIALTALGAAPAAAQTTDPPDPVLGLQYDLMNAGSVKLHGGAADYDTPIQGDHLRLAAGGAFVTGDSLNHLFAGAGAGDRYATGAIQIYAHALFGYRRDQVTKGFNARFGAGIDYPLGRNRSFRAGAACSGDVHVTAGMSLPLPGEAGPRQRENTRRVAAGRAAPRVRNATGKGRKSARKADTMTNAGDHLFPPFICLFGC